MAFAPPHLKKGGVERPSHGDTDVSRAIWSATRIGALFCDRRVATTPNRGLHPDLGCHTGPVVCDRRRI